MEDELDNRDAKELKPERAKGALALVGAWASMTDEEIDAFIAHVYAERAKDTGRPVLLKT
ncbi:MAG: hypothetical protein WEE64_13175 [Dehalococcoidia bacterium]